MAEMRIVDGKPVVVGHDSYRLGVGTRAQKSNRARAHEGQEIARGVSYDVHLDPVVDSGIKLMRHVARYLGCDGETTRHLVGVMKQILHCHDSIEDNAAFDVSTFVLDRRLHALVGLTIGVMSRKKGHGRDQFEQQLCAERSPLVVAHSVRDELLEAQLGRFVTDGELEVLPYFIDLFTYVGKTADSIVVNLRAIKDGGVYEADYAEHRREILEARSQMSLPVISSETIDYLTKASFNLRRLDQMRKRAGHSSALRKVGKRIDPGLVLVEQAWAVNEALGLFAHKNDPRFSPPDRQGVSLELPPLAI